MVSYAQFSALRMSNVVPIEQLPLYSAGLVENGYRRGYHEQWLGGQYDDEFLPGVMLHYPKVGDGELGAAEVWAGPNADAGADPVVDTAWSAHANALLAALDLPVRIGSSDAEVRALATEPIRNVPHVTSLSIIHRTPDLYYFEARIHPSHGLTVFKVYRVDLVKKSASKGAWKSLFAFRWE